MSQLFHRAYQVSIGTPLNPDQAQYGNVPGKHALTPLRVTFELKKTAQASANKGKISIWNMAGTARSHIAPGMLVTLSAGYRGIFQVLFNGVVAKATSDRRGADIETVMEIGDGEAAISQVPFNKVYLEDTHLSEILQDLAVAMHGITPANPTGIQPGVVMGIPDFTYPLGYTATGVASQILRKLCHAHGLQWSIQNGALNIIPINGSTSTAESAEMISSDTGMLGIPSVNGDKLSFTNLINPNIEPTRMVKIYSQTVNGLFVVQSIDISGDSHGDKWEMKCEGVALPSAGYTAKSAQGFAYAGAEVPSDL